MKAKIAIAAGVALLGFAAIAGATVYNIQYFYGQCISSTAYVTVANKAPVKVPCTNGQVMITVNPYTAMPN